MKYLIILLFSLNLYANINCETHPIYCRILELKPHINKKYAMKLSNIIYKYKGNNNPNLSLAIAMQETTMRETMRSGKVIVFDDNDGYQIVEGFTDICMYQFHVDTIINYNLDPVLLKNDLDYCVQSHFKILNSKKRLCRYLNDEAWTCYHSANEPYRSRYKKAVEKFMPLK
jgi:hypothetical protein